MGRAMTKLAKYYDIIYGFKDYAAEAAKLVEIVGRHKRSGGNCLLDVACGTGMHIHHLKSRFDVEGMDLAEPMLAVARARNPEVTLHQGDMVAFDLGKRFDVVTCLFSSIGYALTVERLGRAVACMAAHLVPGGVLIIEPWLTPESWMPGTPHALLVDEPELKIARVNTSKSRGRTSILDLHHLIGTPEGTEHVVEHHELGLFTEDEMIAAVTTAGLEAVSDPDGLTGRGLLIGWHGTGSGSPP
jgi:SAM-dependent methyltransferase